MKKYDYLIVGSGLYGAVFAHEALKKNKSVHHFFVHPQNGQINNRTYIYLHFITRSNIIHFITKPLFFTDLI